MRSIPYNLQLRLEFVFSNQKALIALFYSNTLERVERSHLSTLNRAGGRGCFIALCVYSIFLMGNIQECWDVEHPNIKNGWVVGNC